MEVKPYEQAKIAGREAVMEGSDMRVSVLTLVNGVSFTCLFHNEISDAFVCLEGPLVVETRAPRNDYVLNVGDRCEVAPKVAHYVHGKDNGPAKFLIIHGVGVYDNISVGGALKE